MALLNQHQTYSVRDFLFIAAGLLGMYAFFMIYDAQDTRSMVRAEIDREIAIDRARDLAGSLGYDSGEYGAAAGFETDEVLLDTLQRVMGRQQAIVQVRDDSVDRYFPYYWSVGLDRGEDGEEEDIIIGESGGNSGDSDLNLLFSPAGEWIALVNPSFRMPERSLRKAALNQLFVPAGDLPGWLSEPDSLIRDRLRFRLDYNYNSASQSDGSGFSTGEYSRAEILQLSRYYLDRSGWAADRFHPEEISVQQLGSTQLARIRYRTASGFGSGLQLETAVTPEGALLLLQYRHNFDSQGEDENTTLWDLAHVIGFFVFGIAVIVIFYFRIRARVVDTRAALVFSMIAGFSVPVTTFLNQIAEINLLEEGIEWVDFVGLSLSMGFTGAFAAIGIFSLSLIGDSLTRQYWPEKLECYDYLRQGMLFNKPVGEAMVRSVILTGLLAGGWAFLLWFSPRLFLEINEPFLAFEVALPPVYLLLDTLWMSMLVVFSIFLVLGPQTYAFASNRWLAYAVMLAGIVMVEPLPYSLGPPAQQVMALLILGAVLIAVYRFWDLLTLFLTYFIFTGLLAASGGWVTGNSPDFDLFLFSMAGLMLFVSLGVWFTVRGEEQHTLPVFVPEYVEELAQEERIKQELQIARDVQQSFLPADTPELAGIDLAAVCLPAYETGGDYYDFVVLDDHRVALAIGDVSGKGIQAAFYMTFTKGILHTLCRETESPAEVLKKANRLFYDNARRGTFISLIYGIFDTRDNTFRFARAGHNPLLHYSAASDSLRMLQPGGIGLGLTVSEAFDRNIRETTLSLKEGDLLLLYTDGVVEALNSKHQFYGAEQLSDRFRSLPKERSEELLGRLMEDVTDFSEGTRQHDDMTMMVIKVNRESYNG